MNQTVSIIIPAYNAARYIPRALRSVLSQTYPHLEVVVVDDGSTDDTADVVRGIGDDRVRYLYQANTGQGAARNHGIRASRGEYLAFLDADDIYLPQKAERQVELLSCQDHYSVVYCNMLHFDSQRPWVGYKKRTAYRSGNLLPELLRTSLINLNTVMMTRKVLAQVGGFAERGRYYSEDWDLWLRLTLAGVEFGYLDEDLVLVEWRPDSNTTMEVQWIIKSNAIEMFRRLIPHPVRVGGTSFTADRTVAGLEFKLALACLMAGRRKDALAAFAEALPSNWLGYALGVCLLPVPPEVIKRLWSLRQRHAPGMVEKVHLSPANLAAVIGDA